MIKLLTFILVLIFIGLIAYPKNKTLSKIYLYLLILILLLGIFTFYSMITDIYAYDPIYQLLLRIPLSNKKDTSVIYIDPAYPNYMETVCYDSTLAKYYLRFKHNVLAI